jgi:hypothetical protein
MTANASFQVAEYKAVLKVPNAALRFTPPWETAAEAPRKEKESAGPPNAEAGQAKPGAGGGGPRPENPARRTRGEGRPSPAPEKPAAVPAPIPGPYVYKQPGAPEYHFEGAAGEGGRPTRRQRVRVWVQAPEGPVPVSLVPGATDGSMTEILDGNLEEGQVVLTGVVQESSDATGMSNPFSASRPPGAGGGSGGRR